MSKYNGGLKFDAEKPRYDLIPPVVMSGMAERKRTFNGTRALREVARIYTEGAKKYEDRNWERGMSYSRVISAAMRHYQAYMYGERYDPQNGVHHLASAVFGIMSLLTYESRPGLFKEFDDRTDLTHCCEGDIKDWVEDVEEYFLEESVYLVFRFSGAKGLSTLFGTHQLYKALFYTMERLDDDLSDDACGPDCPFIAEGDSPDPAAEETPTEDYWEWLEGIGCSYKQYKDKLYANAKAMEQEERDVRANIEHSRVEGPKRAEEIGKEVLGEEAHEQVRDLKTHKDWLDEVPEAWRSVRKLALEEEERQRKDDEEEPIDATGKVADPLNGDPVVKGYSWVGSTLKALDELVDEESKAHFWENAKKRQEESASPEYREWLSSEWAIATGIPFADWQSHKEAQQAERRDWYKKIRAEFNEVAVKYLGTPAVYAGPVQDMTEDSHPERRRYLDVGDEWYKIQVAAPLYKEVSPKGSIDNPIVKKAGEPLDPIGNEGEASWYRITDNA